MKKVIRRDFLKIFGSTSGFLLPAAVLSAFGAQRAESVWRHRGPLATAQNMRTGVLYDSRFPVWVQRAIDEAQDGDTIQISPGLLVPHYNAGLARFGEGTFLAIEKALTVTNIPGKGRWQMVPDPDDSAAIDGVRYQSQLNGITIGSPGDIGRRLASVVVGGFELSGWGINRDDYGCRIRGGGPQRDWSGVHASVTWRDFRVGQPAPLSSGSGFLGSAEVLTLESGEVHDCGWGGYEHNIYAGGRVLNVFGVHSYRTRGRLDGHLLKTRAAVNNIEGCVFEARTAADNSALVQIANGGSANILGNLFIQCPEPSNANGLVWYENEGGANEPWDYAGRDHKLVVAQNVFVSRARKGQPLVFVRRVPGGSAPVEGRQVTVRDNVGSALRLSPEGWSSEPALWLPANSVVPYSEDDAGFLNTSSFGYQRAQGPMPGSKAWATKRFRSPSGYTSRRDSYRGLG